VWVAGTGTGGDQRLHGYDGETGVVIYAGGGNNELMTGTRQWNTGIAARGRIYFAADGRVYAFMLSARRPTPSPTASPIPTSSPTATATSTATTRPTPTPRPRLTPGPRPTPALRPGAGSAAADSKLSSKMGGQPLIGHVRVNSADL
jgi:hypothetical protein